ncbi:MAG: DEAD/DEAH box helicase [Planctomycetes bacterium]|jgi:DEAD/DEAH box helicase domain-containing protein|nr:DEAD/DEAH box helicase [Planctomycetota bacterium]
MDARAFIKEITSRRDYADQIVHVRAIQPREARYAEPSTEMPQVLWSLLRRQNIHKLYTHQAKAIDALAAGKDVCIVTATASGKTLCYNLPVVARVLSEPRARALYVYPTKALAQDQLGVLQRWASQEELIETLRPGVYDGDTPSHTRSRIRNKANVVLTNPDMLHVGILPYHAKWHEFLASLEYLVIDEMHTYRGIFGSHVAGVLRRLLRLCDHYGGKPKIVCCSATIANPMDLAQKLVSRRCELIDDDGSPRGRKYFALWNPPYMDADNVCRRSGNVEAVNLLVELVRKRVQTIVFGKARIVVELVHKYARDMLKNEGDLASRIRPYRGGYLPAQRREIEQELFSGRLLAVTATNALELGIDVGSMDAAVLVGFPGTICSTWQQAGRAGRASQDSLVVLVGYDDPIDQYLMRHPEFLFGASHEQAIIDPDNPHILSSQLACASFEKPISPDDRRYFGPLADKVVEILAEEGKVKTIDDRTYWAQGQAPSHHVSLRNISEDTYAIVDSTSSPKALGNVDAISAPELVYPGAVYLHEGKGYLVRKLDMEAKIAHVEPAEADYYTQPVLAASCRLHEPEDRKEHRGGRLCFGPADVTWQTTAFRKVRYYSMELIGQGKLDLPAQTLSTTGMWYDPGDSIRSRVARAGHNPIEALLGVRNLMLASLPALAMSDRRDISGMVDSSNLGVAIIFIYDRYSGGLGFSQMGFERFEEWLEMCRAIVRECPCNGGCPACVGLANLRPPLHQDPDLGGGYPVPSKEAATLLLKLISPSDD